MAARPLWSTDPFDPAGRALAPPPVTVEIRWLTCRVRPVVTRPFHMPHLADTAQPSPMRSSVSPISRRQRSACPPALGTAFKKELPSRNPIAILKASEPNAAKFALRPYPAPPTQTPHRILSDWVLSKPACGNENVWLIGLVGRTLARRRKISNPFLPEFPPHRCMTATPRIAPARSVFSL